MNMIELIQLSLNLYKVKVLNPRGLSMCCNHSWWQSEIECAQQASLFIFVESQTQTVRKESEIVLLL